MRLHSGDFSDFRLGSFVLCIEKIVSIMAVSNFPAWVVMSSCPVTREFPTRFQVVPLVEFVASAENFLCDPGVSGSCAPVPSFGEYFQTLSVMIFQDGSNRMVPYCPVFCTSNRVAIVFFDRSVITIVRVCISALEMSSFTS